MSPHCPPRSSSGPRRTAALVRALRLGGLSLALAGAAACQSTMGDGGQTPGGPDGGAAAADMVGVSPSVFQIRVGQTLSLDAVVLDGTGRVVPGAQVQFASSDDSIARITPDGVVTGVAEGAVQIEALSGAASGSAQGQVTTDSPSGGGGNGGGGGGGGGDTGLADPDPSCCQAGIQNFCSLPPSTPGCYMTQPGGYCDPNGDGSYTEPGTTSNWDTGYQHYQAFCGYDVQPPGDCCRPDDPDVTNFCHLPPDTPGCPMTARGGYCDPDGDSDYDANDNDGNGSAQEADWIYGYYHYQAICGG